MKTEISGAIPLTEMPDNMETTAIETTFKCGHMEITGGNLADPTFIHADLRSYVSNPGICTTCSNAEKYKAIREWETSPAFKAL